jgi:hypothetical protein
MESEASGVERITNGKGIMQGESGKAEGHRVVVEKGRGAAPLIGFLLFVGVVLSPGVGHAYIGPGAGLSAIGTLLALIAAVVVAIFGFVWFPIKRMLRNLRKAEPQQPLATDAKDAEGQAP